MVDLENRRLKRRPAEAKRLLAQLGSTVSFEVDTRAHLDSAGRAT